MSRVLASKAGASEKSALNRYQALRRLVLALIVLTSFLALLFVRSAGPGDTHEVVEAIGLGLIATGILGRLWSTLYIGGRKAAEIVAAGPYSATRNPLYVFSSIAACGVGAQTGSVIVAFIFLFGAILAFHVVIRREEVFLTETFGQPYVDYCARVPRFFPDPRLFRVGGPLTVDPRRLQRTFFDGLVFFLAMPVLEAIEYLQQADILPVMLRLY